MYHGLILTLCLVSCSGHDATGLTTQTKQQHKQQDKKGLATQSHDFSEDNRSEIWSAASKQSSDRTVPDIDDGGHGTSKEDQEYFDLPGPNLTVEVRTSNITARLLTSRRNNAFVVLTMARSASSTFCQRLRNEDFQCSGEALGHGRPLLRRIAQHMNLNCSVWPLRTCEQGCITSTLDEYWSTCKHRRCGFKVFPAHVKKCPGPQYFRDIGVSKVIILERRNKTAQYESLAKAKATGDFGFGTKGTPKNPGWRKKNTLEEYVHSVNRWYAMLRELYNTSLHVHMEDYLALPAQWSRVLSYLK